jgi:Skp family chaperone for outer membrane proteins
MRAQIRLMELRSKPVDLKRFDVSSLKGIVALINELIRLNARRQLEAHDMRAIVDALEVLRKIWQPAEVEEKLDELFKKAEEQRQAIADLRNARAH